MKINKKIIIFTYSYPTGNSEDTFIEFELSKLSENFKAPLNIVYKHDPELIAGLIIQVGSVMVDTSIKTKLKKLESSMIEA